MRLDDVDLRTRLLRIHRLLPLLCTIWLVLGLAALSSAAFMSAQKTRRTASAAPAGRPVGAPLDWLTRAQSYRLLRFSSYDRSGGNADCRYLPPGETLTLLDTKGPGTVAHLWMTLACADPDHL